MLLGQPKGISLLLRIKHNEFNKLSRFSFSLVHVVRFGNRLLKWESVRFNSLIKYRSINRSLSVNRRPLAFPKKILFLPILANIPYSDQVIENFTVEAGLAFKKRINPSKIVPINRIGTIEIIDEGMLASLLPLKPFWNHFIH